MKNQGTGAKAGQRPRVTDRHEKIFKFFWVGEWRKIEKFFSKKARSAPFFESKSFCGFLRFSFCKILHQGEKKPPGLFQTAVIISFSARLVGGFEGLSAPSREINLNLMLIQKVDVGYSPRFFFSQ